MAAGTEPSSRMTSWVLAGFALAAAVAAAAYAYHWWTAAPAAPEAELAAALEVAAAADGRIALAQPRRAARWVLRHPQALALIGVAAPIAGPTLPRLRPLVLPLIEGCDGPLVLWWRGKEMAAAARAREGTVRALALIAARRSLYFQHDGVLAQVATAPDLLAAAPVVREAPATGPRLAALADAGGRRWQVFTERSRLIASTGTFVAVPERGSPSRVATRDFAALTRALAPGAEPAPAPGRLLFAREHGWGIGLAGVELPSFLRDTFGQGTASGGDAAAPARLWQGLLGEIWVRSEGDRLLLASRRELLPELEPPYADDEGGVTGADVTWLGGELAETLERLPLLGREARALRDTAAFAAGLERARWRLRSEGARIILEW